LFLIKWTLNWSAPRKSSITISGIEGCINLLKTRTVYHLRYFQASNREYAMQVKCSPYKSQQNAINALKSELNYEFSKISINRRSKI
jgi:hypothetical protein